MEKVWLKRYPRGMAAEINPDAYASVVEVFETACRDFADRPSFTNLGFTLSFADLDRESRHFAAYLQKELGLGKGDRVAIMLPNLLQYPVVLFGILRAGLTAVNVNPLYTPRELEHQLRDSGAQAIVILANFAATLEQVLPCTPVRTVLLTEVGDLLPWPKRWLVNFVLRHIKRMVPAHGLSALSLRGALARGAELTLDPPVLSGDDLAFLQYTGGTTGLAKGAMLTHRNMVANMEQVSALLGLYIEDGREIMITPLPLYHVLSLTANCLCFMKHGAHNILITNPRDIPAFVKELRNWRFSVMTGVNTLFNALLNNPDFASLDFSGLKLVVGGGMAVQSVVAERWQRTTGKPLLEGYGLTETSPVISCNFPDAWKQGSIGLPAPSTEISIRDEDGKTLGIEQRGELWVRGPQVMKGYWQRPEETAQVMDPDGWFGTGDIAMLDPEGFLRIVDRKKDMIVVSGFNVYPNEVEDVLVSHPGVIECACIGVPDERSGEAVKAFVVLRPGSDAVSPDELIAHCRQQLTGYKVPHQIEFRTELPKSNVGKILRRSLRAE